MASTTTANLAPTTQIAYDKRLLDLAMPNFTVYNHTKKFTLPNNSGRTLSMRRYVRDTTAATGALTEGVNKEIKNITSTNIEVSVTEHGNPYGYTSLMVDTDAIDPNVVGTIESICADNANLTLDTLCQTEAVANFQNFYPGTKASGTIAAGDTLKAADIDRVVTSFRAANVKPYEGDTFHMIAHPNQLTGLRADTSVNAWADYKYSNTSHIEKGMESESKFYFGTLGGVKIYTSSIIDTTAIGSGGAVTAYRALIFGDEALGTLTVGKDTSGFRTIVKKPGSSGISDNMDRLGTVSWYTLFAVKNLDTSAAGSKSARGAVLHTTQV